MDAEADATCQFLESKRAGFRFSCSWLLVFCTTAEIRSVRHCIRLKKILGDDGFSDFFIQYGQCTTETLDHVKNYHATENAHWIYCK